MGEVIEWNCPLPGMVNAVRFWESSSNCICQNPEVKSSVVKIMESACPMSQMFIARLLYSSSCFCWEILCSFGSGRRQPPLPCPQCWVALVIINSCDDLRKLGTGFSLCGSCNLVHVIQGDRVLTMLSHELTDLSWQGCLEQLHFEKLHHIVDRIVLPFGDS
jgi:hypothetical protein